MDAFYCGSVLTRPREYPIMYDMKSYFLSHKRTARTIVLFMIALLLVVFAFCMVSCDNKDATSGPYAAVSDEFRTDYYVGEALSVQGTLKMYTDARTFIEVPITEEMVSGFDSSGAGTMIVKVTYGEFVASVAVTVHPAKALSITLDEDTLPSVIYRNKPFPSTVTMSVTLSNGTTLEHIPVTAKMLGGFNSEVAGDQNVSVTYLGASASFVVLIKEDKRVSIELVGAKSEYAVNEPLSVLGANILVHFESGDSVTTSLLQNNVYDFSTALGGDHVALVKYRRSAESETFVCEYRYFVRKSAETFECIADTLPAIYEKGDLLPATGKGVLTYDDGTFEVVSIGSENLPDFSTADAGEKAVQITVSGVSDTYHYTVLPSIRSVTPYGFTSAVRRNSLFDGLGELIVVYEDAEDGSEQRESIALASEHATRETTEDALSGAVIQRIITDRLTVEYVTSELGDIVQHISFRTRTADFTVHVYSEEESETAVESLSIAGVFPPIVLGDPVDVTGVQVTINYKYKAPVTVNCDPNWVSVDFPDEFEGDYVDLPVELSCFGVTVEESRNVRVLSPEYAARVTALYLYGMPALFLVGAEAPTDNVTLHVVYGGGYRSEDVLPDLGDFDASTEGEKTLTVTYGGKSKEVAYRVISEETAETVTALSISNFDPILFVEDSIEDIDRTAYELTLIYGYGYRRSRISLADESVTLVGGPFAASGRAEITVNYDAKVDLVCSVTVYPKEDKTRLTSIGVEGIIGAEVGSSPDFSAYYLTLIYGYGSSSEKIPISADGVRVSDFSISSGGLQTVTISYRSQECTAVLSFRAGMSDNVLQRLEITDDSRSEFTIGDELSGVKVIAVYNVKRVAMDVTMDMAPEFSTETAGTHSITVSYGERSVLYRYIVVAPLEQGSPEEQEVQQ